MATVIVKPRVPTLLGSIAAISTSTTALFFGLPDLSHVYRGSLTITAQAGAVTSPTWVLEASLDNGASWFVVPVSTAITYGLTGQTSGDTAPLFASRYDVSGLGGAIFKFGITAGTAITAMPIYALAG